MRRRSVDQPIGERVGTSRLAGYRAFSLPSLTLFELGQREILAPHYLMLGIEHSPKQPAQPIAYGNF